MVALHLPFTAVHFLNIHPLSVTISLRCGFCHDVFGKFASQRWWYQLGKQES